MSKIVTGESKSEHRTRWNSVITFMCNSDSPCVMNFVRIVLLNLLILSAYGTENSKSTGDTHLVPEAIHNLRVPYHVSVQINGSHRCGGSLISILHVLTAAHCITLDPNALIFKQVTVKVGSKVINQGEEYGIRRLSRHRDFVNISMEKPISANDIGVITVIRPITLSIHVRPISLPRLDLTLSEGSPLLVSGFGSAEFGSPQSQFLKNSNVRAISQSECHYTYGRMIKSDQMDSVFCAKLGPGHGICDGDSGGPLVYKEQGREQLVGIVSGYTFECRTGDPDLYTNVLYFIDYVLYELKYDFRVGELQNSPAEALDLDKMFPSLKRRQNFSRYSNHSRNSYRGTKQNLHSRYQAGNFRNQ